MTWETRDIVIAAKAYPNPSKKYGEAVCVAGVMGQEWIRLYPVPFRRLPEDRKFSKYDVVRLRISKHSDGRPESYRPDIDSISILRRLSERNEWRERVEVFLPTAARSMCDIQQMNAISGKSLGMFQPSEIVEFDLVQDPDEHTQAEQQLQRQVQLDLWGRAKTPVDSIPHSFVYRYKCRHPQCRGHRMKVVDWEAAQLYRKLRDQYDFETTRTKMREKWVDQMFAPTRDSYFFVGNMAAHHGSFIILGVFWPPKNRRPTLFDRFPS